MKSSKCASSIITDYINGEKGWSVSRCKRFENRVYRIPRKDFHNIELNLDFAGCYIMIAESEKSGKEFKIYVGSSDSNIKQRISSNHEHDEWWDELIIFTHVGSKLQGSEAVYLEKKIFEWFSDRKKKFEFMNISKPKNSFIDDIDKMNLDHSFEMFKFITRSTGFRFFIPKIEKYVPKQNGNIIQENNIIPKVDLKIINNPPLVKSNNIPVKIEDIEFICKRKGPRNCEGKGRMLSTGEFEVFKGSIIVNTPNPSFEKSGGIRNREQLIEEGIISRNENNRLVFTKNHIFSSATGAANVIVGGSAGYDNWKDGKGKSLKKYIDEKK